MKIQKSFNCKSSKGLHSHVNTFYHNQILSLLYYVRITSKLKLQAFSSTSICLMPCCNSANELSVTLCETLRIVRREKKHQGMQRKKVAELTTKKYVCKKCYLDLRGSNRKERGLSSNGKREE